ncbi:MAG: ChbG/HpnK family deacetylase, partial [Acidobacteriota bacterium]|nr:ChbG/HpnK family deacetylase [Acidobacteriota bacterium]
MNADDFGRSHGINRGVIEAFEQGIVTSTSLMVRWPAAREAAAYARENPELSVGLHLDLFNWLFRDGVWWREYEVVPAQDASRVEAEVERQISIFRDLMGRNPTHLDSHHRAHRKQPVRSALKAAAKRLGVQIRWDTLEIRHCGEFYGRTSMGQEIPEAVTVDNLTRLFTEMLPGITELSCHPGYVDDLQSVYEEERAREVRVLCDPGLRSFLLGEGIHLCSFKDIQGALPEEARTAYEQEDFARAQQLFEISVAQHPHQPWSHLWLSRVQAKRMALASALNSVLQALRLAPNWPPAMLH